MYIGYKLPTFQGEHLSPSSGTDDGEKPVTFNHLTRLIAREGSVVAGENISDIALEKPVVW
jgi:hypothetical protein